MAKQPNNINPKNIPQGKKPKSSRVLYIIYGVIMMVLLFTMFNGGSAKRSIDWSRLEAILERGDYEKITVVNQAVAEIIIKDSALRVNPEYSDLRGKKTMMGGEGVPGVVHRGGFCGSCCGNRFF